MTPSWMTPRLVWGVLVGTPTAVELAALASGHPEWTLSPQLRWVCRTHTKEGVVATALALGAGAAVLAYHLANIPPPKESL